MNRLKKNGLLIFFFVVMVWFIFSTKIIVGRYNKNLDITADINVPDTTLATVYYSIDDIYESTDIFNSVNIWGWALCPTSKLEENQMIFILLESEKKNFKLSTKMIYRPDLIELFQGQGISIEGQMHGFSLNFSPYLIPDDQYSISILCQEGEQIIGRQKSQYTLKKTRGESHIILNGGQQLQNFNENEAQDKDIKRWIDSVDREKEDLIIKGWMFLPEGGDATKSIIGITSGTNKTYYEAATYIRSDLITITNEENCKRAGFIVRIPAEDIIDSKSVIVDFYIKNQSALYKASDSQIIEVR